MNQIINVLGIALLFYFLDLIWKESKPFKKLCSFDIFNKKVMKIILIILSFILTLFCVYVYIRFTVYLLDESILVLMAKCLSLLLLYFIISLIFIDNCREEKSDVN